MTRDTFDLFQDGKRERGRFGDNEQADSSVNAGVKSDLVDLDLAYCGQTPKALGVKRADDPGRGWAWLPKSLIEFEMTGKGSVRVTLPEWLAKREQLI